MVGNIEKIIGKVNEMMEVKWLITLFLLLSFFNMYLGLQYRIGFLQFVDNPKNYFQWLDMLVMPILFSFTFVLVLPVVEYLWGIFTAWLLIKMNIDTFGTKRGYCYVSDLKLEAAQTNNTALWNACIAHEKIISEQKYLNYSGLGIIIFETFAYIFSGQNPILVETFWIIIRLGRDNGYLVWGFIFAIIYAILMFGLLFFALFCRITDYTMYYPSENSKN